MAASATITIGVQISGLPSGNKNLQWSIGSATAAGEQRSPVNLAIGDNVISVPAGAKAFALFLPAANATLVRLGGAAGFPLAKTDSGIIPFDSATLAGSLTLNAALAINGCEILFV
jgi:hypothetical protein